MAKPKQPEDKLPEKDANKRRDEALGRMLRTPPKPHKAADEKPRTPKEELKE